MLPQGVSTSHFTVILSRHFLGFIKSCMQDSTVLISLDRMVRVI